MFSLLVCWRWYVTGRERAVLRTSCSLSCLAGKSMKEAENVRFFEPHILCPVLWGTMGERQRTCGSSSCMFSLLCRGKWYATGREKCAARRTARFSLLCCGRRYADGGMCGSKNRTFLSPFLWEMVRKRKRECTAQRATHSLPCSVGDGVR